MLNQAIKHFGSLAALTFGASFALYLYQGVVIGCAFTDAVDLAFIMTAAIFTGLLFVKALVFAAKYGDPLLWAIFAFVTSATE